MYLFQYVSRLCDTRELNKCISSAKGDSKGIPNQGSHSVDDTLEEIKIHGIFAVLEYIICWCNCNFEMYSLVLLIYCNSMFIPGCIVMYLSHFMSLCSNWDVSIMRKLCQVIVGNPLIGQGLKSP